MSKLKKQDDEKLIEMITKAADDKQAINIKTLDVRKISNLLDYIILCSAESQPQLRAIEKEIDKSLRSNRIKGLRWQGLANSGWIVLDLGSIVVHVMGIREREYYNLEELWSSQAVVHHY